MLWRERVRREVAAMLAEYDAHAQILGIKHIRAVAGIIADGLPSPDERNGFVVVPDTLIAKMQDEMKDRIHVIERAVMAALMHHKPDYRSPRLLDEASTIIARFVEAELVAVEEMRAGLTRPMQGD